MCSIYICWENIASDTTSSLWKILEIVCSWDMHPWHLFGVVGVEFGSHRKMKSHLTNCYPLLFPPVNVHQTMQRSYVHPAQSLTVDVISVSKSWLPERSAGLCYLNKETHRLCCSQTHQYINSASYIAQNSLNEKTLWKSTTHYSFQHCLSSFRMLEETDLF